VGRARGKEGRTVFGGGGDEAGGRLLVGARVREVGDGVAFEEGRRRTTSLTGARLGGARVTGVAAFDRRRRRRSSSSSSCALTPTARPRLARTYATAVTHTRTRTHLPPVTRCLQFTVGCTTGCMNTVGCTTSWVNYANKPG